MLASRPDKTNTQRVRTVCRQLHWVVQQENGRRL